MNALVNTVTGGLIALAGTFIAPYIQDRIAKNREKRAALSDMRGSISTWATQIETANDSQIQPLVSTYAPTILGYFHRYSCYFPVRKRNRIQSLCKSISQSQNRNKTEILKEIEELLSLLV